ncbi:MAG: 23S rRNA (adenine(2503)-C(2))-methyltransferase RlmN [Solirubrobacteraceae bacterium]|nr:23S rRNA (adenine(2503)-C(2))-methyltransferase RlmN [Solirubrobacteraceae bacterium]
MDLKLLEETLDDLGEPGYRFDQVWGWTAKGVASYDEMGNVPASVRAALTERVPFSTLELTDQQVSQIDGTVKALFHTTKDRRPVEAVMMSFKDGRSSLCLSSQSGCPLTCTFCATGTMKFGRNLTHSEILDQALHFRRMRAVDHVVFMGMGEPMMNIDNVLATCAKLPDVGVTNRRTAISTVGWLPGIERLIDEKMPVRLALSLHAPDSELRSQIMPVNERYDMEAVLEACTRYGEKTNRDIFIEYVMLERTNDEIFQAHQLGRLLDPKRFKVNLIPYNPTGSIYDASSRQQIHDFRTVLEGYGLRTTVRVNRGRDIDGACGQLAAKAMADADDPAAADERAAAAIDAAA